ncbi:MAG: Cysteine-tRNA ligase [Clostridiales bacterium]|jgi:cysteinyl-tRNA synthetase|nr:Cysteine-tRNA ligase [Clostridiales bacterium]
MKIYNTLSKQKEEFVPLEEGKVKMYVCGPTVYNLIHIGNARPIIVFDTVRRYFEHKGFDVNFVQNFTDVDDKIINRAKEEGITTSEVTEKYIEEFFKDADGLNIKRATTHPKATEEIQGMIEMISTLIEKDFAYEKNGNVYFKTLNFEDYGKLSKKNIEDLVSGSRVAINEEKEDPMDFVLWKPKKPGEPAWESPWGEGRPGWHIECSVMSKKYLGEQIDIHAGGEDLIFPHHENEIAQSESANGKSFAKYWMHNGFLNIDNKKMSKSEGNFFTIRDINEKYSLDVLRFFMLSAHYRTPINFSDELMKASQTGLERIRTAVTNLKFRIEKANVEKMTEIEEHLLLTVASLVEKFEASMEDDFNTADAIASIFELVKFANLSSTESSTKEFSLKLVDTIIELCDIIGIKAEVKKELLDSDVDAMIQARQDARKNKDFAEADRIRVELLDKGIVLEDTREGVRWKRA